MNDLIVRLLFLLAIFAAAFLIAQVLLGVLWRHRQKFAALNRRLEMIEKGQKREDIVAQLRKNSPSRAPDLPYFLEQPYLLFQRMMFAAALPISSSQMLIAVCAVFCAFFLLVFTSTIMAGFAVSPGMVLLLLIVSVCVTILIPFLWISMRAQARRKKIEDQFPVALDVFVRALRSGHPIASAIDLLTQELEDPIGSEFGIVADEVAYGADLTDALDDMAERWDNSDMRMFVVSLAVQKETGGNLAEILQNLAGVIRERSVMYMKVRALSSEGRLTGVMLTALPIFSLVGMFLVNPGFYIDTADDPIFIIGFSVLVLLFLAGVLWIRRLIDLEV